MEIGLPMAKRNANAWYTIENIYCLLRLFQTNEGREEAVRYDELDELQTLFEKELELEEGSLTPLGERLNQFDGELIFNANEDSFILHEAHASDKFEAANKEEVFELALEIHKKISDFVFGPDFYFEYENMLHIMKAINELETAEEKDDEEVSVKPKKPGASSRKALVH